MRYSIRQRGAAFVLWACAVAGSTSAIEPYQDYRKHVESAQNLTVLKGDLFGESVNLYTGKTEFVATDINLPGNNALPVQLRRRFSAELDLVGTSSFNANIDGVGGWEVDVPYISGTFPSLASWPNTRCSVSMQPTHNAAFRLTEIWQGNTIHIPGGGDRVMLRAEGATPAPTDGVSRLWSTSHRDAIDCIPMQYGLAGEGYRVRTTDGIAYYFDAATSRFAGTLEKSIGESLRARSGRERIYLLATRVEDRFGNWVQYAYNGEGKLERVWSSDGREISLTYSAGHLASATAAGRTWAYHYAAVEGATRLSAVIQPDASRWTYAYSSALRVNPATWDGNSQPGCRERAPEDVARLVLTIGHPSGASGTFELANARHFRSGVHASECPRKTASNGTYYYELNTPNFFDVVSLFSKTISGPGLPEPLRWTYAYGNAAGGLWGAVGAPPLYPCTTCQSEKPVVVTNPDGTATRYRYGSLYALNEGRLLGSSLLDAAGTTLRTATTIYMTTAEVAAQPFAPRYGFIWNGDDPSTAQVRPVVAEAIDQDGESYQSSMLAFDALGRPTRVNRSSSTGSRTDVTEYQDDRSRWLLGNVHKVTNADTNAIVEQTHYDALMRPVQVLAYGQLSQALVWNADGTVASVADGRGNTTTLAAWKRGIPQRITFADGTSQTAEVSDHGWLTSVTTETGARTGYEHDAMGRITGINWPTGDTVAWAKTTQSFSQVEVPEHGIAAGHWRQSTATGNAIKHVYYDAFWRPLVSEEYDAANRAATQRFLRFAYDEMGRQTFVSHPASNADVRSGAWTTHDGLGRVRSVSVDSEHGVLTTLNEYLPGGMLRTTTPRGHVSVTRFQAFGEPADDAPMFTYHPEGVVTDIHRDVFGKPLSITRRSVDGSTELARKYVYDTHQRLCKSIEPENGSTLMAYDAAGNLAWSAAGLALPSTGSCDLDSSGVEERKIVRTYDARNRLKLLSFPDSNGNQSWEYTADGKPRLVYTLNQGGAGHAANTYAYNNRGLLIAEWLAEGSVGHEGIGYSYDAGGALAAISYPGGRVVDYSPNALGQPTRAGAYASDVQYYANGAMKQFTYGNGVVHSMAQNARQLPGRVSDSAGGVDNSYEYDANGNVERISDNRDGARSRAMTYDGLDRLVTATSASFGGNGEFQYGYDAVDNLRLAKLAGVKDHHYWYDERSRLTNVRDSAGATVMALSYDLQGNLALRNGSRFTFDYGNRLAQVAGKESYRYDRHGRRALSLAADGGGTIWSFYSNDGQLRRQRNSRTGATTDYIHLNGSLVAKATEFTAPGVPSLNVPAYSGNGAYTVGWSSVATAERYELRERAGSGEETIVYSGGERQWSASGRPGGSYSYSVRACLRGTCGGWSSTATVVVQLPPTNAPMISLAATSANGVVSLTWTAVEGADRYCVTSQYQVDPWSSEACTGTLSMTIPGIPAGGHLFGVHGCNAAGCGPSGTARTTMVFPPSAVPGLSVPAKSLGGSFAVSWSAATEADAYELEESVNGGPWAGIVSGTATSQAFSAKPTGSYAYRVRAGNAAGWGAYSAPGTVVVIQPPAAPVLAVPASSSSGSATVTWSAMAMTTNYPLEHSVEGGEWQLVQNDGATHSVRTGLSYATYAFRVRACNEAGCSGYSNVARLTSVPPPATPQITYSLQTRWRIKGVTKVRCNVRWTDSRGAQSYELQVPGSGLIQYRGSATAVTSPNNSNAYCAPSHVVRACNSSGCSAWSTPPQAQPVNDLGDQGGGIPLRVGEEQ